ncbi:MAG: MurR/RpiR family transcriptional regulator [Woeseiaceae bacterium]|nr:MurR/RpiR family transcriptional regulator [Woeseiaceae bacterium]
MLQLIENRLKGLSPAESLVARWILAHPRDAANSTLAAVAAACEVSEPTVIRFCRHLGLGGFRDLTLRLTESLSQPSSFVHRDVNRDDTIQDAAAKVMDSAIQTLVSQRSLLRNVDIGKAANVLARARQIVFAGIGGSGHVSDDAQHKFFRLGIPCSALSDPPSIQQFAAIAERGDVLVLTSNSGQWPELSAAASMSRQRGASVIALTDPTSDLAAAADIPIPCGSEDETSLYTPRNSRLSQLAVLDVLQVATALELGDAAANRLRRTKMALSGDLTA